MKELEKIWKEQIEFNSQLFNIESLTDDQRRILTKEMLLHMISEIDELLASTGTWKIHKRYGKKELPKKSGITEELVDMFKYLVNIAILWDISPKEFIKVFWKKSEVVRFKYLQDKLLLEIKDKPVVITDLDGVVNSYPNEWLAYLRRKLKIKIKNLNEAKEKIPPDVYQKLKHEFRENGGELKYKPNKPIIEFLSQLKKNGYHIVILTSRPVWNVKRYYSDTLEWLRKYNVPFDCILWTWEKGKKLFETFSNVVLVLEDDLDFANQIASWGYKVILIDKSYNRGKTHGNVVRVKDLYTLYYQILPRRM